MTDASIHKDGIRPSDHERGFTLVEILVVLFLIALITSLIIPKLNFKRQKNLRSVGMKIASESRFLYWQSLSRQKVIRLYFDLERQKIYPLQIEPDGEKKPVRSSGRLSWIMPPGIRIDRIENLHQGKVDSGKTFIQYFPTGSVEPTTIHLSDRSERSLTLSVNTINGKVHIYKGDVQESRLPPMVPGVPGGGPSPSIGGG